MWNSPLVEFSDAGKSFDNQLTWAVRGFSFDVAAGETLALLGSSGSGKTTLLRMINRLIDCDEGSVSLGGQDVRSIDAVSLRRSIGYVFQSIGLFPHRRVAENIATVPGLLGWSASRQLERVNELLDLVGLPPSEYGRRFPDELSGGQRQRVGFARALAGDPAIILMDEPFGALDAVVREELQQEVLRITQLLGKTVVLVTHDLFEAITLADRIAVIHEGRLEQIGTPSDVIMKPATPFVASLVSRPKSLLETYDRALRGDARNG